MIIIIKQFRRVALALLLPGICGLQSVPARAANEVSEQAPGEAVQITPSPALSSNPAVPPTPATDSTFDWEREEARLSGHDDDDDGDGDEDDDGDGDEHHRSPFKLSVHGYGELNAAYHDFGPDATQAGGAPADHRATIDPSRFVLELEGNMPGGIEFGAEVEFEHGGTGSTLEIEYEEFGEYEHDVEKGGEVNLEELYLRKQLGRRTFLKAGRFYVATGLLSAYHLPTTLIAATRPEAEVTVIPAVWDEMGVSLEHRLGPLHLTAQVVSGLDSSGFSSPFWVTLGHQGRFELLNLTSPALVGRVDLVKFSGLKVGASAYWGDTTGNRPKDDMDGVFAPVLIVDGHLALDWRALRVRAMGMWGSLQNAELISDKNSRLSNDLQVLRSPVADQALAVWAEAGFDVAGPLGLGPHHRLEPFVRFDHYDTMFKVSGDAYDNPRFNRTVYTAGLGYTLRSSVVVKGEWSHRSYGSSDLNTENTVRLMTGFVY